MNTCLELDVITSINPKWEELIKLLRNLEWVFIKGSISGIHPYTYNFKYIIGDESTCINERPQEGIIKYMTDNNELGLGIGNQSITLKWKRLDEYNVLITILNVNDI